MASTMDSIAAMSPGGVLAIGQRHAPGPAYKKAGTGPERIRPVPAKWVLPTR